MTASLYATFTNRRSVVHPESSNDDNDDIIEVDEELDFSSEVTELHEPYPAVRGLYHIQDRDGTDIWDYYTIGTLHPGEEDVLEKTDIPTILEAIDQEFESANYHSMMGIYGEVYDAAVEVADERIAGDLIRNLVRTGRYYQG
jgi:hypothetical protein